MQMQPKKKLDGGRARRMTRLVALTITSAALLLTQQADAAYPKIGLTEMSHEADVIFVGTPIKKTYRLNSLANLPFTDYQFAAEQVVSRADFVSPAFPDGETLSFAGGEWGKWGASVSDVPTLEIGEFYLIFAVHDGKTYANPLVGGPQGIFRIVTDEQTGERYPVTLDGAGIVAVERGEMQISGPVTAVRNGVAQLAASPVAMAPAPRSEVGQPAQSYVEARTAELLTLDEFIVEVQDVLAGPGPAQPVLRGLRGAGGNVQDLPSLPYSGVRETPVRDGLTPLKPTMQPPVEGRPHQHGPLTPAEFLSGGGSGPDGAGGDGDPPRGTPLCYCGYFDLFLTMEQVPDTWWSWQHNNDMMWLWNQFMDVYRYVPSDGLIGDNSDNEFCGWPSDATLYNLYGYHWNGALALCITWYPSGCPCCELSQADIMFNPDYSWYQDFNDTLGYSGRILYRPVVLHELGHSWGMQRGTCTEDYNYDSVSAMHAYYYNVVEDGWGIHYWDAYALRRLYDDQTSIIGTQDIGAESYYGGNGLNNATTNASTYMVGDSITVQGMTIENMSYASTPGVRIRLWLSTNKIISTSDYQMGSYWYWDSLNGETYWSGNLTTTVPDVPPGTYYVGIMVTRDGDSYNYDSLSFNNATFLYQTIQVLPTPPVNDDCADAINISNGYTAFDTTYATTDGNSHGSCQFDGQTYNDVWYRYTATCTGTLLVTTCEQLGGSADYDTDLVVYGGSSCGNLSLLGCNDDDQSNPCGSSPDYHSTVRVNVVQGQQYRIRVGGYSSSSAGTGTLFVRCSEIDCPGDVDGDGYVGQTDLGALLAAYGSQTGDGNYNANADFDGDGFVGQSDLGLLLSHYGESC